MAATASAPLRDADGWLTLRAPAKLNLTLRVGDVRPDGYHELESIVALVRGLADTLQMRPASSGEWSLTCDDPTVPTDERNLVLKAARKLADVTQRRDLGAAFALQKRIPAGAGLGGGSSDAAAALRGLNALFDLRLGDAALRAIAAEVGSDVPLFLANAPLVLMRGRGEIITPLDTTLDAIAAIILPDVHSSTPAVYRAFDELPARPAGVPLETVLPALGGRLPALSGLLFNDLEPAALQVTPTLKPIADALHHLSHGRARMSGSGAAFYWLLEDAAGASAFADRVRRDLAVRVEVAALGR